MENTITVTIPCQEFDIDKYFNGTDCYLHNALTAQGFDNFYVGDSGGTFINGVHYSPMEEFGMHTVAKAFAEGKDITVTLIKQ